MQNFTHAYKKQIKMALESNALVRVYDNQILVVLALNGEDAQQMFAKIKKKDTEAFVIAHTTNVNGHIEIHLDGEVIKGEDWAKKAKTSIQNYRVDQMLEAPIWVCRKVKSLYESVMS